MKSLDTELWEYKGKVRIIILHIPLVIVIYSLLTKSSQIKPNFTVVNSENRPFSGNILAPKIIIVKRWAYLKIIENINKKAQSSLSVHRFTLKCAMCLRSYRKFLENIKFK